MAIVQFGADPVLSVLIVSAGTLIMNGTLLQTFNTDMKLTALDSLVVLNGGACNITYFSANNFTMTRGPLFYSNKTQFLLAKSSFV